MVIALALVANLAHRDPALLSQIGRVDHVDRVRPGAHHACKHGARDRLDVELGGVALNLHIDRPDLMPGDLADQPAQLLRE